VIPVLYTASGQKKNEYQKIFGFLVISDSGY
jgi:hypothetical protein